MLRDFNKFVLSTTNLEPMLLYLFLSCSALLCFETQQNISPTGPKICLGENLLESRTIALLTINSEPVTKGLKKTIR